MRYNGKYTPDPQYNQGGINVVADALSRLDMEPYPNPKEKPHIKASKPSGNII